MELLSLRLRQSDQLPLLLPSLPLDHRATLSLKFPLVQVLNSHLSPVSLLFASNPFIAHIVHELGQHGGTVVSTAASQLQGSGFDSRLRSLWILHILPVSVSGCSGFLPHSKDVRVRLIGRAKLSIVSRNVWVSGVNVWGCGDRAWSGIVVGADLMGQMAFFCTVGFLWKPFCLSLYPLNH